MSAKQEFAVGDWVGVKNNHGLKERGTHQIAEVRYADRGRNKGKYKYVLCCHNINGHCGAVLWSAKDLVLRGHSTGCKREKAKADLIDLFWHCYLMTAEEYFEDPRWNESIASRTRRSAPKWFEEKGKKEDEEEEDK